MFLVLLSMFSVVGLATPANISIINQTAKLGQTFNVDINIIPNGNSASGWQANVSWDPTIIRVNGITEGNYLKLYGSQTFFMPGTIANGSTGYTFAVILGPNSGVSNPGVLMTLNITTIGVTHNSTLTPLNIKLVDPNGNYIPFTLSSSRVVVAPKYDVNMDGIVDIADLTLLAQYYMQSNAAYDINGDGIIDIVDVVIAAQHFGQTW